MSVRKNFLSSHARQLDSRPLVVGTLTGRTDLASQLREAGRSRIDLLEVRLDTFSTLCRSADQPSFASQLIASIRKKISLPILATVRSAREAGAAVPARLRLNDVLRAAIFRSILPRVD